MDCSPPGSSVHGILQARILEWVAISYPGDLSDPGIEPGSPALQADSLPSEPPGKPITHPEGAPFSRLDKDSLLVAALSIIPHILPHEFLPPSHVRQSSSFDLHWDVFLALGLWDRVTLSYHLILCMFLWWQLSQWSVIMWTAVKPHACHRSLACIGQVQGGSSLI